MALVVSSCEDKKGRKSSSSSLSFRGEKKPWMLKDYLGDDLSSCSSNGFRSFPRRQCCVAVCNIIENEVITRAKLKPPSHHTKRRMIVKNDCSFSSALQRASMAVVNAVKLIPFNSTPAKNDDGKRFLSRSFSKKLFRRSFFWKKESSTSSSSSVVVAKKKKRSKNKHEEYIDEIERWISSGAVGKEKYKPLDLSNDTTVTSSVISNSDGKSSDSSWSDITFTTSDSQTSFSENDDVERRENVVEEEEVTTRAAVLAGEDFVEPAVHHEEIKWVNEVAEKEHTSPISVLDFPDDDEGGSSSPFTLRVSRTKGTKERLMKKLGRFECLVGLEPVNLESLLSSPDLDDHRSLECTIQPCSTPSFILSTCVSEQEEEDDDDEGEVEYEQVFHESQGEKQAQYLLNVTKANVTPSPLSEITNKFGLEYVLLDFFRENITQRGSHALLKAAEDWLNGHYDDNLILGWEVKDKRQAYIRDMEEGGWWPRDTKVEREEIVDELGDEVMTHLIEEFMVEFCSLS